MQGLQAIAVIASSMRQEPVPTTRLARHIGLCLSSTEIIVKHLKNGGLIRSHRGPGGGYQLHIPIKDLSVWDVVSCFGNTELPARTDQASPEMETAWALANQMDEAVRQHLQAYRLIDVLAHLPSVDAGDIQSRSLHTAFHLKPLRPSGPPLAPSWVFDLAKFTHAAHM